MTLDPVLVSRLLTGVCSGGTAVPVHAPFSGEILFDLPVSSTVDVDAVVAQLRQGQRRWSHRPLAERSAIVLRFHDLLLQRRVEGLDIVQWETGKARRDAMEELLDVCINARHYARDARRLLRPRRVRGVFPAAVAAVQTQIPKGVVGFICPWNYPLTLAVSDAIPALIAGNAALVKPDPQTSLTALWVVDLLHEAGVPDDVVTVVTGDGASIGSHVVESVDYVMFTGSTAVGRQVAARCGERLVGCSLELGGKNAMVVSSDADPRRAAEIAVRAAFSNAGQLCVAAERMYVHERVYEAFLDDFVARTERIEIATAVGWKGQMGTLISQRQVDRVKRHVEDATAHGAQVLAGGRARPEIAPFAFEPTILEGVTSEMDVCDEETFGPVVSVYPVQSDDEAIARVNDTAFGLNASVVTNAPRRGQRIAAQIKAGTVNVNEAYGAAWGSTRAPMGGMGDSGLGRRHGDEGLLKYTESQTIATQRFLGFGPQFGWDDERWMQTLAAYFSMAKKLGLK